MDTTGTLGETRLSLGYIHHQWQESQLQIRALVVLLPQAFSALTVFLSAFAEHVPLPLQLLRNFGFRAKL